MTISRQKSFLQKLCLWCGSEHLQYCRTAQTALFPQFLYHQYHHRCRRHFYHWPALSVIALVCLFTVDMLSVAVSLFQPVCCLHLFQAPCQPDRGDFLRQASCQRPGSATAAVPSDEVPPDLRHVSSTLQLQLVPYSVLQSSVGFY